MRDKGRGNQLRHNINMFFSSETAEQVNFRLDDVTSWTKTCSNSENDFSSYLFILEAFVLQFKENLFTRK